MANRHLDWLRQSEADLAHARTSVDARQFEWACFAAHQAAEKAVKALFMKGGADAWGHTITTLLGSLPGSDGPSEDLVFCAKVLDKHYIPTRYPNGFDSGAPTDYYTREEALASVECAERILRFCADSIQRR